MGHNKAYDKNIDFTVAIAGNPNVGKSTIFNSLTRYASAHWKLATEKLFQMPFGKCRYHGKNILLVDIPGTYSLMSNSEEEEIARNYICFGNHDAIIVVLDATCIERNLNLVFQILEITKKVVVCVNLLDEATKKGISIDLDKLSSLLGIPVVGTIANKSKTLNKLLEVLYNVCKR